jgi:hypothetical protein
LRRYAPRGKYCNPKAIAVRHGSEPALQPSRVKETLTQSCSGWAVRN